jgi:hypothetical protein
MERRHQADTVKDQRRSHRYRFKREIEVRIVRNGKRETIRGSSLDITVNGMSALMDTPLCPGEIVEIILPGRLPGLSISLRATIVNEKNSRCGFRFFKLTPEQAEYMKRTIETVLLESD